MAVARLLVGCSVLCALGFIAGCDGDKAPGVHATQSEMPLAVKVGSAATQIGTSRGVLRGSEQVGSFLITKFPIQTKQYLQCVEKGGCTLSENQKASCSAWADENASEDAARCLTVQDAERYCAWVGGHLPTLGEWMLAARGPEIAAFPWGNDPPTCAQHWAGRCADQACAAGDKDCEPTESLAVGKHPKGASPSGAQDFLLASGGELTQAAHSVFECGSAGGGCVVRSGAGTPSRIDYVASSTPPPTPEQLPIYANFAFRCAWGDL